MPKWFNTAGPCKADIYYMLSPTASLLGNFSFEDLTALYQQHTEATGQIFTPEPESSQEEEETDWV